MKVRRLDPDDIPEWLSDLFEDWEPEPRETMQLIGGGAWLFPRLKAA